jgi:hypothetical protein
MNIRRIWCPTPDVVEVNRGKDPQRLHCERMSQGWWSGSGGSVLEALSSNSSTKKNK